MTYTFVDCQGFAGGFSCGAALAGWKLRGKRENKKGFGVPLLETNRAFLGDDWQSQLSDPADWEPLSADAVIGTPPCSAFSSMSAGLESHGAASKINDCMWDLMDYAVKVRPQMILMESVGQAFTRGQELMRKLADVVIDGTKTNYNVYHILQNNYSMGGCTMRRRYFLVLSQVPFGVEPATLRWLPTVGDALGDLKALPLTWDAQPLVSSPTWWSHALRSTTGMVDGHMPPVGGRYSGKLFDLVKGDGNGLGGVPWLEGESETDILRKHYDTYGRLPDSWCYESHSGSGLTRDKELLDRNFDAGGFAKCKCWRWDGPGRVITGAGPYQVWHPNGRFYTHREVARVLGFPDDWRVGDCAESKQLYIYWGKGTSVHPARWVMDWARESLDGHPGKLTGELLSDGTRLIDLSRDWLRTARRYGIEV